MPLCFWEAGWDRGSCRQAFLFACIAGILKTHFGILPSTSYPCPPKGDPKRAIMPTKWNWGKTTGMTTLWRGWLPKNSTRRPNIDWHAAIYTQGDESLKPFVPRIWPPIPPPRILTRVPMSLVNYPFVHLEVYIYKRVKNVRAAMQVCIWIIQIWYFGTDNYPGTCYTTSSSEGLRDRKREKI